MGSICGSNIYLAKQAPRYPAGYGVGLGTCTAGFIMAFVLRRAYQAENRKRDEFMVTEGEQVVRSTYSDQELLDLGDKSPFYRYTI